MPDCASVKQLKESSMENKGALFVYNASAGSGKTHNLSGKYMRYLLQEFKKDPFAYKHIMAVTFTNKATWEMKSRIISRLYDDACNGAESEEREMAKRVLQAIVHDYSMFRVSTIDSFFQRVLKAFALEMGRQSAFETSLDNQLAVENAVANLYSTLGEREKASLLKTLTELSLSRIEENRSWNWRDEILTAGKQIFNENYHALAKRKQKGEKSLAELEKHLKKQKESLKESFIKPVAELMQRLSSKWAALGVVGNISRGYKFTNFLTGQSKFYDIAKGVIEPAPEYLYYNSATLEKKILKKNHNIFPSLEALYADYCHPIIELYNTHYKLYNTINLILANIKQTSVLDDLARELELYLKEQNLTLLAEANIILKALIDGSDTPFVYEKIGVALRHYLLDEFQDTSNSQWQNFKPLVKESIASGNESLLVGDVKQSIYRWRGGDWAIFANEVKEEFANYYTSENLDVNYRSLANIVAFNNALFSSTLLQPLQLEQPQQKSVADYSLINSSIEYFLSNLSNAGVDITPSKLAGTLAEQLREIYSSSYQKVREQYLQSPNRGSVTVVDCVKEGKDGESDAVDVALADMLAKIKELSSIYNPSDMAILVSTNSDGYEVVNYLISNGISVVSGDSLSLASNNYVMIVVEILRKLAEPSARTLEALLSLTKIELRNSERLADTLSDKASGRNLFDLCRYIIRTFLPEPDDGDIHFIKSFMDRVLQFSIENGNHLMQFLKWWDANSDKFYIPEPQNKNSVRVMTMHKAKGLDFKVVFIPYMRDSIPSVHTVTKWCATSRKEIDYSGPLYIKMSKQALNSYFEEDYIKEYFEGIVDNLNLLYVSLTRPKEKLILYLTNKKEGSFSKPIREFCSFCTSDESGSAVAGNGIGDKGDLLFKVVEKSLNLQNAEPYQYKEFILGNPQEGQFNTSSSEKTDIEQQGVIEFNAPFDYFYKEVADNPLRGIYEDDENIRKGLLYHQFYSYLTTCSQTPQAMRQMVEEAANKFLSERSLSDALIAESGSVLIDTILKQLASVSEYRWFSDEYNYQNEVELIDGAKVYRPDRVLLSKDGKQAIVIDYKFGGEEQKYVRQVKNYIAILQRMGYRHTTGYIWYVLENKVVEVL